MRKILFILSAVILFLIIPITFFDWFDEPTHPDNEEEVIVEKPKEVHISAVGDVMMHLPQIQSGKQTDGTYDFRPFFKEIKQKLSEADITFANFETTLRGTAIPYQGYPRFNAPDEIILALKDAGVDVLSTANNHSMDTGTEGVIRTYQRIKELGLNPVGTAPSVDERREVIIEKNGIKVAFLAYTEMTNGIPVPKDKPYLVNLIDIEQIKEDIANAKQRGAEYILVSLHFGLEYHRQPSEKQIQIAHQVLEAGADAILGSHPHVLQPIQEVTIDGKKKVIIYSMGNFISNQKDKYTDEGVIVDLHIQKNPQNQEVELTNVTYLPTLTHKYYANGRLNYRVIPLADATPAFSDKYPSLTAEKWKSAWNHTQEILNTQVASSAQSDQ